MDENSNDLYLQGRKTYLSLYLKPNVLSTRNCGDKSPHIIWDPFKMITFYNKYFFIHDINTIFRGYQRDCGASWHQGCLKFLYFIFKKGCLKL